jgi:hypothetical protein
MTTPATPPLALRHRRTKAQQLPHHTTPHPRLRLRPRRTHLPPDAFHLSQRHDRSKQTRSSPHPDSATATGTPTRTAPAKSAIISTKRRGPRRGARRALEACRPGRSAKWRDGWRDGWTIRALLLGRAGKLTSPSSIPLSSPHNSHPISGSPSTDRGAIDADHAHIEVASSLSAPLLELGAPPRHA